MDYVLQQLPFAHVGFVRSYNAFRLPSNNGNGYLAGSFPGGLTKADGVPTSATVRAVLREDGPGDGYVVRTVKSNEDGTWIITGLDPARTYDVIGRKGGYNDVISSRLTPKVI